MKKTSINSSAKIYKQCENYLLSHPGLKREDFYYDPEFGGIALQSFGKTGFSSLIQEPEKEPMRNWTIWVHPNPNIIGIDDIDMIRKMSGPAFDDYFKILAGSQGRKESEGFYFKKDADGNNRKKNMVIVPIDIPGKPFSIACEAFVDEYIHSKDRDAAEAEAEINRK